MKPSRKNFLVSQLSVCMSFFLFSMQVHEKQILSPLLVYTLCATNNIKASWLYRVNLLCTTSLFTLMRLDNADQVFLSLQVATMAAGWGQISTLEVAWTLLMLWVTSEFVHIDLVVIIGNFVHFVSFALFFCETNAR